METDNTRLVDVVAAATEFCAAIENIGELEKREFIDAMLLSLPRLYLDFSTIEVTTLEEETPYFPSYMDEDYYDSIRRRVEGLLGPDDVFLETFVEDMKYSDIPIAVSISESLADIFQDLYNFVSIVRESGSDMLTEAFLVCQENFQSYWSQTLCNVMRPLNRLRYHGSDSEI